MLAPALLNPHGLWICEVTAGSGSKVPNYTCFFCEIVCCHYTGIMWTKSPENSKTVIEKNWSSWPFVPLSTCESDSRISCWKCWWNQLITSCYFSFLDCICLFFFFLTLIYSCDSQKTWQKDCPTYKPVLYFCIGFLLLCVVICIYLFIFFCCWNIFHWNIFIWHIWKPEWHWDIAVRMTEVIHAAVLMVTSWLNFCI